MPKITPAKTIQKTRNFDFLFGRYQQSECTIPYFQVSMTFSDAARYLNLVNEMPGAASMNWKIQELFQRDIDWPRVENKIVPYLTNSSKPQFFNSLTIALLPIEGSELQTFSGHQWNPPNLDSQESFTDGTVRKFGPITCGYWGDWENPSDDNAKLGQLCWNTEEICGVAIDGQHRLAAIKVLAGPDASILRSSSVPVILIVLDEALGFSRGNSVNELIETLRELFIDLNKHAEKVRRARQILLDDRDPSSICVRRIVGEQLCSGVEELAGSPPKLPLTLIDWHSEQAKFDTGPYLSTILGLDWAVAKILAVKPFEDPMAFESTKKLINRLESRLGINLEAANARLEECRKHEKPFGFEDEPNNELQMISDGFGAVWSEPLTTLLTEFLPYKQFLEARQRHQTLCPEFANWFALKQNADEAGSAGRAATLLKELEHGLKNRENPIAVADYREALDEFAQIKSEKQLAFTVVFQRALFLAFLQFTKVTDGMISNVNEDDDFDFEDLEDHDEPIEEAVCSEEQLRAEQMVEALNKVFGARPELFNVGDEFPWHDAPEKFDRFWLWSFTNDLGTIDFSQAASKRASDWLLLIALFGIYTQSEEDHYALVERVEYADSGLDLKLLQCLNRLSINTGSVAEKILLSRDQEDDTELKWREIYGRSRWLWDLISST